VNQTIAHCRPRALGQDPDQFKRLTTLGWRKWVTVYRTIQKLSSFLKSCLRGLDVMRPPFFVLSMSTKVCSRAHAFCNFIPPTIESDKNQRFYRPSNKSYKHLTQRRKGWTTSQ